ncbi:SIP domain-containing protein [Compostimonas suwonensis]|uniref:Siderophore-interacting protein n=1 Tax=Compostimonas suwonensis TaxID=1048394 RepID=A0A2M9BUK9_9MICO|nr:SIP domain-containing protein [Compostimonas suwonensis]PJJ61627.1 siderophore-interacting protein [Compostimonas suwonensis]
MTSQNLALSDHADHASHTARTAHRDNALSYLLVADDTAFGELELAIAALPLCARGRVFVEVQSASDVGVLAVPPRMTVSWLVRDSRSGAPGTAESCHRGTAMERAATAWASEMLCGEVGDAHVWLAGEYRGVAAIHEFLTESLGLPAGVVTTREAYRLGVH